MKYTVLSQESCNPTILEAIKNANALANGVQAHYIDDRRKFVIENQNMTLGYTLTRDENQQVSFINNKSGASYIENTMDAFVTMTDGSTVFASKTSTNTTTNIFRYGYYYYEVRLEEQVFSDGLNICSVLPVSPVPKYTNDLSDEKLCGDVFFATVACKNDPFIVFNDVNIDADKYHYLRITAKVCGNERLSGCVHVVAGNIDSFSYLHNLNFNMVGDGELHTYTVCLKEIGEYRGSLTALRLDIDGLDEGQTFEIHEVSLLEAVPTGAPTLSTARIFHTYSDKLHHVLQVAATEDTYNISAIGLKTTVAKDKVDKLIIKDSRGLHNCLDSIDWASAEYVGFDIKEAGIFGYILPADKTSGSLMVTREGDEYVIIQSRTPENKTVFAGNGWPKDASTHICSEANLNGKKGIKKTRTVSGNDNDFFIGQRIYTDEHHNFDKFIIEAEIERNPLSDKDISVNTKKSDEGEFKGYDALRGSYEFHIMGSDFNRAYYKAPNEKPAINFSVKGNAYDRNIYVLAATEAGGLECAALLDENQLLIPIPIEVAKNFCGDGEENIYMRLDTAYGEAIFPMLIRKDEQQELTVLHLYQNWGRFPIKQLSSIQYHAPYYHLSTGVTETNCIVPWRHTKDSRIQNILPDHRPMSAPMWSSQPQHTSGGTHTFLHYRNQKGDILREEVTKQVINSYGPIYAELEMQHVSCDGKIKVSYTHAEMPQTDENRAYYFMTYDFLDDMDFSDFKNEWDFYNMGKNTHLSDYHKIGYLDESYVPTVIDAEDFVPAKTVTLGTLCPYFSFFDMTNPEIEHLNYVNLSFIVRDSEFIINGEKANPSFALRMSGRRLYLTLDLGKVSFKKGDRIAINAIIMPWGSQESDYSGKLFAPDKNVRNVRQSIIDNPTHISNCEGCEAIPSYYLPMARSINGKDACFIVRGKEEKIAVRIYGFERLARPSLSEYINGKWEKYELSSKDIPDNAGNSHAFDGYGVFYDSDGTYSYSFIVTMTEGKERSFKVEV